MKMGMNFLKTARVLFLLISYFLVVATAAVGQTISSGETLQSNFSQTVPVLDSQIDQLEWDDAQKIQQNLDLYNLWGNKVESHPLTLYIKNDDENLYIAGSLTGDEHDGTMQNFNFNTLLMDFFIIAFDNNDNGAFQAGEDKKSMYVLNQTPGLQDEHLLTAAEQQQGRGENSESQDTLGGLNYSGNTQTYTFEISIPLNSGDTSDIRIQPGQKVRWNLFYVDKFNVNFYQTIFGGLTGFNMNSTANWSYIQLGTPTGNDIQIFAQIANESDLDSSNLEFVGSHYDLVLSFFPFRQYTDQLKQQNSELPVFLFANPYFVFGDKFWNVSSQQEAEAAAVPYHLVAEDGETIMFNLIYPGLEFNQFQPLIDIRNSEWQDYFASQIRKHIDLGGMDGVFLDTMDERLPNWAMAPGNNPPRGYTAEGWKQANYTFLQKINDAFTGTDLEVIFNGISRFPGDKGELPNSGMLDVTSGAAIEAYSIYMSMDTNENTKKAYFYDTILQDLNNVSQQGKKVIIEVYGDQDDEMIRLYALCSFLLVQSKDTYFYFTKKDEAGGLRWRPEWDVKLGKPLGFYQEMTNGAYSRNFEKGKVLVNPLNYSVVVSGLDSYRDWKSGQQVSNITLPPYSGALLVSAN